MSNQPTIPSEIAKVEWQLGEWKREMKLAESNFNLTKNLKHLRTKMELVDKIEKAEKFLAQHRVKMPPAES